MKEYILQLIANMFDDIKLLIDVADFQKKLVEAFEIKGLLGSYKNDVIPAPKKSMSVNESKIKNDKKDKTDRVDSPAAAEAYKRDYRKGKIPFKKDEEIKTEVTTIALKLAEDPSLSDAKLASTRKSRIIWPKRR